MFKFMDQRFADRPSFLCRITPLTVAPYIPVSTQETNDSKF